MRSLIGSIRGFARTEAVGLPGPAQSNLTLPDHAEFIICNQSIERKLFMRRGFHHPQGNQQAFLNGLTLLDDLVPYQRRASMPVNVAWKSKEATSLHATGSSTSKSSR
jgi:hypothetical protein